MHLPLRAATLGNGNDAEKAMSEGKQRKKSKNQKQECEEEQTNNNIRKRNDEGQRNVDANGRSSFGRTTTLSIALTFAFLLFLGMMCDIGWN